MDREHVKAAGDKIKGEAKEAIGKAAGDASMVAKGKMDKAKGEVRQGVGDMKDKMRAKDGGDYEH